MQYKSGYLSPAEELDHVQRKWQRQQQQRIQLNRLKQQNVRSRTSADYRHKRMP